MPTRADQWARAWKPGVQESLALDKLSCMSVSEGWNARNQKRRSLFGGAECGKRKYRQNLEFDVFRIFLCDCADLGRVKKNLSDGENRGILVFGESKYWQRRKN